MTSRIQPTYDWIALLPKGFVFTVKDIPPEAMDGATARGRAIRSALAFGLIEFTGVKHVHGTTTLVEYRRL